MNVVTNAVSWEFLDEPLWRWFLFFGALILISIGWRGILSFVGTKA